MKSGTRTGRLSREAVLGLAKASLSSIASALTPRRLHDAVGGAAEHRDLEEGASSRVLGAMVGRESRDDMRRMIEMEEAAAASVMQGAVRGGIEKRRRRVQIDREEAESRRVLMATAQMKQAQGATAAQRIEQEDNAAAVLQA